MLRAQHVGAGIGGRAGNHQARVVGVASRIAVQRLRQFQRHHRAALRRPQDMAEMGAGRGRSPLADADRNARRAQPRMAAPRHTRIRILQRRNDADNARSYDGIGAGRRFGGVAARLKRDIERRPLRQPARLRQRDGFGMRATPGLRGAAPDNDPALHHQRANGGVGCD